MMCNVQSLIVAVLMILLTQAEYLPIQPSEYIYRVMPTRKIYKMNFQWQCEGWSNFQTNRDCEESTNVNPKQMILYREDIKKTIDPENPVLVETTRVEWDATPEVRKMWINTTFRQNNDFIQQWLTIPLDLWDYTYANTNSRTTNMSIEFTGSHLQLWYNDYRVVYIWLRDQAEDITYTTHVKFAKNFYHEGVGKTGEIYWYFGDESLWCWVNCSQANVFNFSGYYDEVLSPRTDRYQVYLLREEASPHTFCTYYNCTRDYENYPRCLMVNYTAYNTSSEKTQELLDLRCVNETYELQEQIDVAIEFWAQHNLTNLTRNYHDQKVPDDPLGVGIVDGLYKCLNRDYCHDLRPFQLFNFDDGSAAHILGSSVLLIVSALYVSILSYIDG